MADGHGGKREGAGPPAGNTNSRDGHLSKRIWKAAIKKALEKKSRVDQIEALEEIATKLLDMALDGDMRAMQELGLRLDGKPEQEVTIEGGENPINHSVKVTFHDAGNDSD